MRGIGPFWRMPRHNKRGNHHAWASFTDKQALCKLIEYDKANWVTIPATRSSPFKRCVRCQKMATRLRQQPDVEEDFL